LRAGRPQRCPDRCAPARPARPAATTRHAARSAPSRPGSPARGHAALQAPTPLGRARHRPGTAARAHPSPCPRPRSTARTPRRPRGVGGGLTSPAATAVKEPCQRRDKEPCQRPGPQRRRPAPQGRCVKGTGLNVSARASLAAPAGSHSTTTTPLRRSTGTRSCHGRRRAARHPALPASPSGRALPPSAPRFACVALGGPAPVPRRPTTGTQPTAPPRPHHRRSEPIRAPAAEKSVSMYEEKSRDAARNRARDR
jgi:hypothetical protein